MGGGGVRGWGRKGVGWGRKGVGWHPSREGRPQCHPVVPTMGPVQRESCHCETNGVHCFLHGNNLGQIRTDLLGPRSSVDLVMSSLPYHTSWRPP